MKIDRYSIMNLWGEGCGRCSVYGFLLPLEQRNHKPAYVFTLLDRKGYCVHQYNKRSHSASVDKVM
jgi:hypothetical protein